MHGDTFIRVLCVYRTFHLYAGSQASWAQLTTTVTMETGVARPRSLEFRQHETMSECIPLMDAREVNATERTKRPSHCTTSCSRHQSRPNSSSETDPDDEALDWPSDGATRRRSRTRSLCRQRRLPASQSAEHPLLQPEPTARCKERKAPPSPSLLARVKEHIRNHVLLPQPAVMADLRQRAVEAFEASLSEREPTDTRGTKSVMCRAATDCPDGVARRAAYRRRSISDDTYNRPLPAALTAAATQRTNSLNDDGVVCSTLDLLSIFKSSRTDVVVGSTGTSENFTGTSSVATDISAAASSNCESLADDLPSVGHGTTNRDIIWTSAATCKTDQRSDAQNGMPEVEYDEYGQTWDVYGADYDPEVLGAAIEKHLERIVCAYQSQHDDICEIVLQSPHTSTTKESRRHDAGLLQRMLGCLTADRSGS